MHENHPILNIHEAASQTIYEVKNKRIQLEKIKEQVKYEINELTFTNAEIERKYADMIQITKDSFNQLKKLLDLKEIETITSIDSIKDKKLFDVSITKEALSKKEKRLENVIKMIDTSKDLPAGVMMESMKYLSSVIQTSINLYETTFSSFNTTFPYPNFKTLFRSLDLFNYNDCENSFDNHHNSITPTLSHRRSLINSSIESHYASPVPFRNATPDLPVFNSEDPIEQRKFISKLRSSNSIKLS